MYQSTSSVATPLWSRATEENAHTEWTGGRSVDDLKTVTGAARYLFRTDEPQRDKIRDWMAYAVRFGVLYEPVDTERLYPV